MTILETRFMELMPRLLQELIDQVKGLRNDIKELRETNQQKND